MTWIIARSIDRETVALAWLCKRRRQAAVVVVRPPRTAHWVDLQAICLDMDEHCR